MEFVDNEVLVLLFDSLMHDLKQAWEALDSSLRSEVWFTTSEYMEITEQIDGLRTRALLLRRQFIYFNLYLNKVIVKNGAEYEILHHFIRRLSQSIAELEEYRQNFDHRHNETLNLNSLT